MPTLAIDAAGMPAFTATLTTSRVGFQFSPRSSLARREALGELVIKPLDPDVACEFDDPSTRVAAAFRGSGRLTRAWPDARDEPSQSAPGFASTVASRERRFRAPLRSDQRLGEVFQFAQDAGLELLSEAVTLKDCLPAFLGDHDVAVRSRCADVGQVA